MFLRAFLLFVFMALSFCGALAEEEVSHREHEHEHEHEHERVVELPDSVIKEFKIRTERATLKLLSRQVELPAEIVEVPEKEVHIVPPVKGFVRRVFKGLGDKVQAGEVLAIIDSPELADLKSSYLIAKKKWELAKELFEREKILWSKKIVAEESFLKAKQELELAEIELRALEQKLLTLGFSPAEIKGFEEGEVPLGRYPLRAPISGVIVEKHLSTGEMVGPGRVAFRVVDLSEVWAVISVYRQWIPYVKKGQKVRLVLGEGQPEITAVVDYVSPSVDPETRAVRARVVLDNSSGELRPGLLIKAFLPVGRGREVLAVPESAVQYVHGHPVVFVRKGKGFEMREVELGERYGKWIEVRKGLSVGEEYVVSGAFTLKAEMEKEAFEHAGHVH
ncbi:efflux RND transporter periplasmic adaptor subunit [Phorcysia thermohydrogeniphila]|uniref:Cobalt-zinc-cadmium efflux system membrane fusion protein n=1 Tax=Phorcysia thermohydrogeniphila TaxID=936138 RepID=A0A4R1GFP5_9BACT|nr:efflux RND transporter periplasmic adaptor subunit [Phorcysia thermohydrogeniphila]TCK04669.1 cobalt-zinc-cadmium efflux system membrane fusion protein [Phorcysia thermohydrogeniphila]